MLCANGAEASGLLQQSQYSVHAQSQSGRPPRKYVRLEMHSRSGD